MKICYIDESGNDDKVRFLIMVGIMVDAARLHRSRREFGAHQDRLQRLYPGLRELKSSKLLAGKNKWKDVPVDVRRQVMTEMCSWIKERKHCLLFTGVDRVRFKAALELPSELSTPWACCALHIAAQVQKLNQGQPSHKGHTFLVFDEEKVHGEAFLDTVYDPPAWTDEYYSRDKKQDRFDQIIDTPFFVHSHHVGLVQVADLYALMFRRHLELLDEPASEQWNGERGFITARVADLLTAASKPASRWVAKPQSDAEHWFRAVAPDALLSLGR